MHPPELSASARRGERAGREGSGSAGEPEAPPRRSARLRAAVSGTVVLVLIGFGAAVVASIVTPGGERVPAGQSAAADSPAADSPAPGSPAPVDAAGAVRDGGAEAGDADGGAADRVAPHSTARAVFVHVTGAVASPGVVELSQGARVIDVVARAGGATDDADLAAVNLAREVVDGEQIHVPRVGEQPPDAASALPGSSTSGGAAGGAAAGGLVNINTAGSAELESLPGVGPALAGRIIAWREQNGPFRSVDELLAVSGIGEKTLSGFRDQVGL